MKKISIIIIACLFCLSCGVKDDPEYRSEYNNNKPIKIV